MPDPLPNPIPPPPPPPLPSRSAEFYGDVQGANYYSVAVVPASLCTAGVTLASLRVRPPCCF